MTGRIKYLLWLCMSPLLPLYVQAQQVVYSEAFTEPEAGWNKLLAMRNGHTAFIHISEDGLEVKLYDREHKRTGYAKTEHSMWTGRTFAASRFEAAFEVSGRPVIFISQVYHNNVPKLHRIIIDSVTGRIDTAEILFEIEQGAGYDAFTVCKDPVTEYYLVSFNINMGRQRKFIIFDGQHKAVKNTTLTIADIKKPVPIGYYMYDDVVYVFYTDQQEKRTDAPLYLAALAKEADTFIIRPLEAKTYSNTAVVDIRYNEGARKLQYAHKGIAGDARILYIDPVALTVTANAAIEGNLLREYTRDKLKRTTGYNGSYSRMVINDDNTTAVIMEESYMVKAGHLSSTETGSPGVLILDDEARETEGYVIAKPRISGSASMQRPLLLWEYYSNAYFSTPGGNYILFNNTIENVEMPLHQQPRNIPGILQANAVLYKLVNGDVKRTYLFGNSETKFLNKYAMTGSAIYSKEQNSIITLMTENTTKGKRSHIAWITLPSMH